MTDGPTTVTPCLAGSIRLHAVRAPLTEVALALLFSRCDLCADSSPIGGATEEDYNCSLDMGLTQVLAFTTCALTLHGDSLRSAPLLSGRHDRAH